MSHRAQRTLIAVAALVAVVAGFVWQVWYPGRSFDPTLWRNSSLVDGVRHDMAVRMLARNALVGRTREEVLDLLGPPYWEESGVLAYQLGPNRPLLPMPAMDSEWLSVILGSDGRVIRCKIWED